MLVSKLSNKYKVADPAKYLAGADWRLIDPVFAGRLAYFAKCYNIVLTLTEGFRSSQRQEELYKLHLIWKETGRGSIHSAAKPGSSWHEFRLAVDISNQPLRSMTNAQLEKFGLYKPITGEPWHLQPIETKGLSGNANRVKWQPKEEEVDDEMVEEKLIYVDKVPKRVKCILKDNENYIRLRDFDNILGVCKVEYDARDKMIVVKD